MNRHPRSIAACIRDGLLDAELAALVWVAVGGRVPALVASPDGEPGPDAGAELAAALVPFVAAQAGRAALGAAGVVGDPGHDVLVPGVLAGGQLRRAVRGVAQGFGLVASLAGSSLEDVLVRLRSFGVGATPEMIGRMGIVLILAADPPHRVVAAHYLRPVARDAGGHVQHLAPAVLATWDERTGRWDHFGWGLYPELAHRLGMRPGDLERAHAERAEILTTLVRSGVVDDARVLATIAHAGGHA